MAPAIAPALASCGTMGGKLSRFTQEELSIYESCTCLDGAELATIYEKFIKMGGRRVTKGADEASYRRIVGQKTVRNMMAGSDVSLSQVRGASTSPLSHEGASSMQPRPVSGLRSHPIAPGLACSGRDQHG